jgi:hypothetical protein
MRAPAIRKGESVLFPELNSERVTTAIPVPKNTGDGTARNSRFMLNAPSETWAATVRLWVDSCLEIDSDAFTPSRYLFDNFVKWIEGSGEKAGSKRALSRMLLSMGFKAGVGLVEHKTTRGILGVKIRKVALRGMVPVRKEENPILAWVQDWDMPYIGKAPTEPDPKVTAGSLIVYIYYSGTYIVHVGFEFYAMGWIKVTRIFGRDGTVAKKLYPKKIADALYAQLLAAGFKERQVKGFHRKRYEDILAWRVLEGRRRMGLRVETDHKASCRDHAEVKEFLGIFRIGMKQPT